MSEDNIADRNQALFDAAAEGDEARVRRLVEEGADPGFRTKTGWSVLHNAARACGVDTLRFLVERGAPVNLCDANDWSVLHCAAAAGRLDSVVYLADELKLDVGAVDRNGWTALHSAASAGSLDVVNALIGMHEDVLTRF